MFTDRSARMKRLSIAIAIACLAACSSKPDAVGRCTSPGCMAQPATGQPLGDRAGAGAAPAAPMGDFSNPTNTGLAPGVTSAQPGPAQPVPAQPVGGSASPDAGMTAPVAAPIRETLMIDDCGANNPAGLDSKTVATLTAGGPANGARWLYPYQGTVFPRGMLAPTLMWDGAPGDVVYVHITASLFDYRACLRSTGSQQLQLPQEVWKKAGDQTLGSSAPFMVEVNVLGSRGAAVGPLRTQIVIAQATLKGSIFYNSYVSANALAGSVYRIPPGGQSEVFLGGVNCFGCHSVSANGTHLIASNGGDPGASYALTPMTAANPPMTAAAPKPSFVGLSPDGSVYVNTALPAMGARPTTSPIEALLVTDAALYETDSGAVIASSGLAPGAMMPTFSPDGSLLVFNDANVGAGTTLAAMDYDAGSRKFVNPRVIFRDQGQYPGWPFVLPDNRALIFARGASATFSGEGAGVIGGAAGLDLFPGPASDLYIVDLESGTATLLASAMGMNSPQDPTSYTPFGDQDLHRHYYPTVSPVAAGGYFWIFFDSIRNYGNLGAARQLWGSAITVSPDGRYAADPSHPAFYVTGQEFGTGNHSAFTALDPCRKDGDTCETGIDCCSGFCTDGKCGLPPPPPPGDPPPPPRCSKTDEACTTAADCCNAGDLCLNGFCGQVILQ